MQDGAEWGPEIFSFVQDGTPRPLLLLLLLYKFLGYVVRNKFLGYVVRTKMLGYVLPRILGWHACICQDGGLRTYRLTKSKFFSGALAPHFWGGAFLHPPFLNLGPEGNALKSAQVGPLLLTGAAYFKIMSLKVVKFTTFQFS